MQNRNKLPLISSEITGLWNIYESDSMSICIFDHFLKNVDDDDTKNIIKKAKNLSETHLGFIRTVFSEHHLPVPAAFGPADVNMNAPRLFTDSFYLLFLSTMASFGIDAYAFSLRYVSKPDILNFHINMIKSTCDLYNETIAIRQAQGVFVQAPSVEVTKEVSFVEKTDFLHGLIGQKRSFISSEVMIVFGGILIDILWRALSTGFGQTAENNEVKDYMFKGKDIASGHLKKFADVLIKEDIPVPSFSESFVTDSTIAPYSDKLIMNFMMNFIDFVMNVKGIGITSSRRNDLKSMFAQFEAVNLMYAEDGLKILIDNGWMEQPPQVVDHKELAPV